MSDETVLVGDVGGTSARLALARAGADGDGCSLREARSYPSRDFAGLAEVVEEYLDAVGRSPGRARYAVACPVRSGTCRFTNLDWEVDARDLSRRTGIERTRLLNDFDAVCHSLPLLGPGDVVELQRGSSEAEGTVAVIGAGTGLGQGFVTSTGEVDRVHSSEGGHRDFAPRGELQGALLRHLRERHGRVSCERVLSGSGLVEIYRFLVSTGREPSYPETREAMEQGDPPAVVSRRALSGGDPACDRALDVFVSAYGAESGNLALTVQSTGGLYVAGGIAPRILPRLRSGPFMEAFRAKSPMTSLMERVPVRVITNDRAGLLGAAAAAFRAGGSG